MERAKREENTQTYIACQSRIKEIFSTVPLSLKVALLVLITLITRVLAFFQTQIISNDGVLYIQMAKLFSEGKYEGIYGTYFNLYPLLIFFFQKFTGEWVLSGQLISIILSTFTVVPIFLLGRSLYGEKVGWLSALFYITLPDFLRYGSDALRDPTSWFFIAITLWLVWDGLQKSRPVFLGLASISAGLGTMTRVESFVLWGALAFYIVFRKVPGVSLRRRGFNVTILVLLFPLLISPVLFSVKKHSGKIAFGEMALFPIRAIVSNAPIILKPQDPITLMGSQAYESLPAVSQGSIELASRHRVVLAISEVIYKFIKSANLLIILILLGLWKRKSEGFKSSDCYLLYTFAALFGLSVFYTWRIFYFSTRHGLTLVLPLLYFTGPGLTFLTETLTRGINRFTSGWTNVKRYLFHVLTFFLILIFLAQGLSFRRTEKINLKEIGLWLNEKGYQGSVIMGSKHFLRLVFYADGKFLEIPGSWEKAIESIRQNGVRVVVIDSCTIEQECPGFLENWPHAKLVSLQGPKRKGEKCEVRIYKVY